MAIYALRCKELRGRPFRVRKSEESQCRNYAPPLFDATGGSEEQMQSAFTVSRLC